MRGSDTRFRRFPTHLGMPPGLFFGFLHRDIPSRSTLGHSTVIFLRTEMQTLRTHGLRALGLEPFEYSFISPLPRRCDGLTADPPRVDSFSLQFW